MKYLFLISGFCLLFCFQVAAKVNFMTLRDIRCDGKGFCVHKNNQQPYTGELRIYYPDGQLKVSMEYNNGMKHGALLIYYLDGKIRYRSSFSYGLEHGVATGFYNNGNMQYENMMSNGAIEGFSRTYYENGKLRSEANYADGKLDGEHRAFYEDGNLRYKIIYEAGMPISGYCITATKQRRDLMPEISNFMRSGMTVCDIENKKAEDLNVAIY